MVFDKTNILDGIQEKFNIREEIAGLFFSFKAVKHITSWCKQCCKSQLWTSNESAVASTKINKKVTTYGSCHYWRKPAL